MTLPEDQLPDDDLPQDLPKVFLSYSRKDRERAQRISDVLRDRNFGVFKDTDDILPTEEWRDRLEQLIEEADTIVFLLSPHSATSEICAWEVEYATSLNKRIAPIVIDDVESETIPEQLARLNYIFCTERDPFEDAIDTLVSALNTDIDWIREHTRLNTLVRRWVLAGKPAHLLLRGQEIVDAEGWRDRRPDEAPLVTRGQAELISDSRGAAARRQRRIVVGAVAGLMLAVGLAAFAFFQRGVAVENERRAVAGEELARENEALAKANERRANETRDAAWLNQSAVLTDWAEAEADLGDTTSATMLLLAALPDQNASPDRLDATRPLYEDAAEALAVNYFYAQEVASLRDGPAFSDTPMHAEYARFSPDGARFVTVSRDGDSAFVVRVWRSSDARLLHRMDFDQRVAEVAFLPDSNAFLTVFNNHDMVRWDAVTGAEIARHSGCPLGPQDTGGVHEVAFNVSGTQFATGGRSICLWNTEDGAPLGMVQTQDYSIARGDLMFIGGDRFVMFARRGQVMAWQPSSGKSFLVHQGTGTMYARVNAARDRLVVADTGSGLIAPGQPVPEDHKGSSTVLLSLVGQMEQIAVLSENEPLAGVQFRDDGTLIVAAQDTRIKTWDAATGELLSADRGVPLDDRYLAQNDQPIRTARFAPGSDFVYSGDYRWTHKLWNARGVEVDRFHQPPLTNQFYPTLTFAPGIKSAVEHTPDTAPTLWRVGGARALQSVDVVFGEAGAVPLDAVTRAAIRDYFAKRAESKLQGGNWPDGEAETLAVRQPGGSLIATVNRDGVRVKDANTGDDVTTITAEELSGLPYRHRTTLFSQNGAYLIVLAEDFIDVFSTDGWGRALSLMSEDASLNHSPPGDYFDTPVHWQFEALKRNFRTREWGPSKDETAPRFVRMFDDLQQLIDHQKAATPRCLNLDQLKRYRLGATPPRWCITGPGREAERNPMKWQPKPPYATPEWRDWLLAVETHPATPPPGQ